MRIRGLVLAVALLSACGRDPALRPTVDAGPGHLAPDAGATPDAGPIVDAGSVVDAGSLLDAGNDEDAGPTDAGTTVDAGAVVDAGSDLDAGPVDAGAPVDAGVPVDAGEGSDGGVFCVEASQTTDDIYTPVNVTVTLPQDKGRILACQHLDSATTADVTASAPLTALGWTANTGYEKYIIQYVSEGPVGTVRRVTALIYVPTSGSMDIPLAAVNHGTSGMGPSCGPSQSADALTQLEGMVLPLVSRGYAAVATDYPGMGVDDGVSPYTVGEGEALAVIDGVRSLLHFHDTRFDASQLNGQIFFMGHSQGGQASLFAHQFYDSSVGGTLMGSVSFAPAVGDMQLYHYLLGTSAAPTNYAGVLMAMSLYATAAYSNIPNSSYLSTSSLTALPPLFHNECLNDLLTDVPLAEATIGQMFTPAFITAAGGCALDGGPCPNFEPWNTDLLSDEPGNFSSAAPALIMQGGADDVVAPNFTACIAARLLARGTPYLACLYTTAQHSTIVSASIADAYTWMETRRAGGTTAFCPQFVPLPAICSPY